MILPNKMRVQMISYGYTCTYGQFYIGFSTYGIAIGDVGSFIINSSWDNLFSTE